MTFAEPVISLAVEPKSVNVIDQDTFKSMLDMNTQEEILDILNK